MEAKYASTPAATPTVTKMASDARNTHCQPGLPRTPNTPDRRVARSACPLRARTTQSGYFFSVGYYISLSYEAKGTPWFLRLLRVSCSRLHLLSLTVEEADAQLALSSDAGNNLPRLFGPGSFRRCLLELHKLVDQKDVGQQ